MVSVWLASHGLYWLFQVVRWNVMTPGQVVPTHLFPEHWFDYEQPRNSPKLDRQPSSRCSCWACLWPKRLATICEGRASYPGQQMRFSCEKEDGELQALGVPRVPTHRQHWTTEETKLRISKACGEPGKLMHCQCGRNVSNIWGVRVHAPKHFTNFFCSFEEFSYQWDYMLHYQ